MIKEDLSIEKTYILILIKLLLVDSVNNAIYISIVITTNIRKRK